MFGENLTKAKKKNKFKKKKKKKDSLCSNDSPSISYVLVFIKDPCHSKI